MRGMLAPPVPPGETATETKPVAVNAIIAALVENGKTVPPRIQPRVFGSGVRIDAIGRAMAVEQRLHRSWKFSNYAG